MREMIWRETTPSKWILIVVILIATFARIDSLNTRDPTKRPALPKNVLTSLFGEHNLPRAELVRHLGKNATSAKRYMLDLYEMSENVDDGRKANYVNKSMDLVKKADTVVSFVNNAFVPRPNTTDESGAMFFDVTSNFVIDKTLATELRIYLDVTQKRLPQRRFKVSVLKIVVPRKKYELIVATEVDASKSDWHEFDILDASKAWREDPSTNLGVVVVCQTLVDGKVHSIDACGFVDFSTGSEEHKPFMVSFYQSGDEEEIFAEQLPERATQMPVHERLRRSLDFQRYLQYNGGGKSNRTEEHCEVHNLYIKFFDLGWAKWIIAPQGFQAGYCGGKCQFPLLDDVNPSSHAIIQNIVHMTSPGHIPPPCCAPSKLKSQKVLFVDEEGNIVMKEYHRMAVEQCGCQ